MPNHGNILCKLIYDTGASKCSTGFRSDFVTYTKLTQQHTSDGIAAGLSIEGYGLVEYTLTTDNNIPIVL